MPLDRDTVAHQLVQVEQTIERVAGCTARKIVAPRVPAEPDIDTGHVDSPATRRIEFCLRPHFTGVVDMIDFIGDVDRRVQGEGRDVHHGRH